MRFIERVYAVISAAGKPLHITEITSRLLEGGWYTRSQSPSHTVRARINDDMRVHGLGSRFQRVHPGVYAVAQLAGEYVHPAPPLAVETWLREALSRGWSVMSREHVVEHFGRKSLCKEVRTQLAKLILDGGYASILILRTSDDKLLAVSRQRVEYVVGQVF